MKKKAVYLVLIIMFTLIFSGKALAEPSGLSDEPYTISGTISLPNDETAESGGLTLSLDASTRNLSGPPQSSGSTYSPYHTCIMSALTWSDGARNHRLWRECLRDIPPRN